MERLRRAYHHGCFGRDRIWAVRLIESPFVQGYALDDTKLVSKACVDCDLLAVRHLPFSIGKRLTEWTTRS
jgi:hypothetical protein